MYQVCPGDPNAFTLDAAYDDQAANQMSDADSTCINDYIGIEGLKIILILILKKTDAVSSSSMFLKCLGATAQCSQSTGANMQQKFCGNIFAFGSIMGADVTNGVVCGKLK